MIRFEDDEEGLPNLCFTRGQKELVQAGLHHEMVSFMLRSTDALTSISFRTAQGCEITAEWWSSGRFRQVYLDVGAGPKKVASLKRAIDTLNTTEIKKRNPSRATAKKSTGRRAAMA